MVVTTSIFCHKEPHCLSCVYYLKTCSAALKWAHVMFFKDLNRICTQPGDSSGAAAPLWRASILCALTCHYCRCFLSKKNSPTVGGERCSLLYFWWNFCNFLYCSREQKHAWEPTFIRADRTVLFRPTHYICTLHAVKAA